MVEIAADLTKADVAAEVKKTYIEVERTGQFKAGDSQLSWVQLNMNEFALKSVTLTQLYSRL